MLKAELLEIIANGENSGVEVIPLMKRENHREPVYIATDDYLSTVRYQG